MKTILVVVMMLVMGMAGSQVQAGEQDVDICDNMEAFFVALLDDLEPGEPLDSEVRAVAGDCGTRIMPGGSSGTFWSAYHGQVAQARSLVILTVPQVPTDCQIACEMDNYTVDDYPSAAIDYVGYLLTCEIRVQTPAVATPDPLPSTPQTTVSQQYYEFVPGKVAKCTEIPGYAPPRIVQQQWVHEQAPGLLEEEAVGVSLNAGYCNMTYGVHVEQEGPNPGYSTTATVPCVGVDPHVAWTPDGP